MNLIGRLQLSTERSKEEDNDGIVQLRILRVQASVAVHHVCWFCLSSAVIDLTRAVS